MTHTFKLTGPEEGQSKIILDKYVFVDGEMQVGDDDTASKYERILCEYYAVVRVPNSDPQPEPEVTNTSLSKTSTKTSKAA
jgi:hypothetical protein